MIRLVATLSLNDVVSISRYIVKSDVSRDISHIDSKIRIRCICEHGSMYLEYDIKNQNMFLCILKTHVCVESFEPYSAIPSYSNKRFYPN